MDSHHGNTGVEWAVGVRIEDKHGGEGPFPPGPRRGLCDTIPSSAGLGSSGPTEQADAQADQPGHPHRLTALSQRFPESTDPWRTERRAQSKGQRWATEVRLPQAHGPTPLTMAWGLWPSLDLWSGSAHAILLQEEVEQQPGWPVPALWDPAGHSPAPPPR